MYELEIMVTGYTAVIATISVIVSKYVGRKPLSKINKELSVLRTALLLAEADIKRLKRKIEGHA